MEGRCFVKFLFKGFSLFLIYVCIFHSVHSNTHYLPKETMNFEIVHFKMKSIFYVNKCCSQILETLLSSQN